MSEHFLENAENELEVHAAVLENNLQAIRTYVEPIINHYKNESKLLNLEKLCISVSDRKESVQIEKDCQALDKEISELLNEIQAKENNIQNLNQQLEQQKEELRSLKLKEETASRDNEAELNAYQKALDQFTNTYQYTICLKDTEDTEKYYIEMAFIINKVAAPYPITFVFEEKSDQLLGFEAPLLLTDEEQKTLWDRYNEKKNTLALLCRLRNRTIKKLQESAIDDAK